MSKTIAHAQDTLTYMLLQGGQGPLVGMFGLAVDNVLSIDVVTADGAFITSNPRQNTDLFWALRGGGPATFGVIVGMTVKTHPEMKTIGRVPSRFRGK